MRIVDISFLKSKSKSFAKAKAIASEFPIYSFNDDVISCVITEIKDYCILQKQVFELISIIKKWTGTVIKLGGIVYQSNTDYEKFVKGLQSIGGKYAKSIGINSSDVSLGDILFENLPLPVVYYPELYGAFFAFSEDFDAPIYFCECEREAIENYLELRKQQPLCNYYENKRNPLGTDCFPKVVSELSVSSERPLELFGFKEGICFRCNNVIPRLKYCHPMYGGNFMQHFGWFVQQEYYRLGIDKIQINDLNVLREKCDPDIYDSLCRINQAYTSLTDADNVDVLKHIGDIKKQIGRIIENSVRQQMGYRKIGDGWVSETILSEIVKGIFPQSMIVRHYRPDWLEGLELDIFVKDKGIAFEYQGIQHFKAVEHWGGQEKLIIQKEHDERKKRICQKLGIKLICINYDEPLNTEFVLSRIFDETVR